MKTRSNTKTETEITGKALESESESESVISTLSRVDFADLCNRIYWKDFIDLSFSLEISPHWESSKFPNISNSNEIPPFHFGEFRRYDHGDLGIPNGFSSLPKGGTYRMAFFILKLLCNVPVTMGIVGTSVSMGKDSKSWSRWIHQYLQGIQRFPSAFRKSSKHLHQKNSLGYINMAVGGAGSDFPLFCFHSMFGIKHWDDNNLLSDGIPKGWRIPAETDKKSFFPPNFENSPLYPFFVPSYKYPEISTDSFRFPDFTFIEYLANDIGKVRTQEETLISPSVFKDNPQVKDMESLLKSFWKHPYCSPSMILTLAKNIVSNSAILNSIDPLYSIAANSHYMGIPMLSMRRMIGLPIDQVSEHSLSFLQKSLGMESSSYLYSNVLLQDHLHPTNSLGHWSMATLYINLFNNILKDFTILIDLFFPIQQKLMKKSSSLWNEILKKRPKEEEILENLQREKIFPSHLFPSSKPVASAAPSPTIYSVCSLNFTPTAHYHMNFFAQKARGIQYFQLKFLAKNMKMCWESRRKGAQLTYDLMEFLTNEMKDEINYPVNHSPMDFELFAMQVGIMRSSAPFGSLWVWIDNNEKIDKNIDRNHENSIELNGHFSARQLTLSVFNIPIIPNSSLITPFIHFVSQNDKFICLVGFSPKFILKEKTRD